MMVSDSLILMGLAILAIYLFIYRKSKFMGGMLLTVLGTATVTVVSTDTIYGWFIIGAGAITMIQGVMEEAVKIIWKK